MPAGQGNWEKPNSKEELRPRHFAYGCKNFDKPGERVAVGKENTEKLGQSIVVAQQRFLQEP